MATAVAIAARDDRLLFGDSGLLTEAWQGVELAEYGDDRSAFAGLAVTAVASPATPRSTRKPSASSIAACAADERYSS